MFLSTLFTASLAIAFGAAQAAQLTYVSSLAMTRCYCVSPIEIGWVAIYNLTSPAFSNLTTSSSLNTTLSTTATSTVWYRNGTVDRDDRKYRNVCGKECDADSGECWKIPCKSTFVGVAIPW
jgi:hypothetical protein